jgi:Pyruvate/2-oxoacid:ferredoxin oxidoreductase gamma subunit
MVGAFCALTGVTEIDSLCEAMAASIPSYRQQHVEPNIRAIRAGAALVPQMGEPGLLVTRGERALA